MKRHIGLIILALLIIIFFNFSIVFGEEADIKNKAYFLGYDDGERLGLGHYKETPNYISVPKHLIPNDEKAIAEFKKEYRRLYDPEFDEDIKENYKQGFTDGYESAVNYGKRTDGEGGRRNYPETLGKTLGEIYGYRDFYQGENSNWKKAIPSDRKLREMYNLNMETSQYRKAFINTFKASFEIGYKEGYERANLEPIKISYEQGLEDGLSIGSMRGNYAAILDVTLSKTNAWTRHQTKDSIIINEYGLKYQSEEYRTAFLIGYWDGFIESYNETHRRLQMDTNEMKTYTEIISIDGGENMGIPGDDKFLVDIEPGTFYNDVVITIDSIPMSYMYASSPRYTQASGIYGMKILNTVSTYDEEKNIKIKFKSYGNNEKYGIYKYHYNKWIYIPSKQEGNYLVASLNVNDIDPSGNIYAVRVDNEFINFYDSRGHWAKEEIDIYVKREIIYGYPDASFRPKNPITRREFITMLSRLYDWYPPFDSSNVRKFKDYHEFGYGEKAISYAVYYDIVKGYSDNTFRPNNPITYREVEQIMARVLNNKNFNWNYYANKLMYEKGFRSKSLDNKNNHITRGEFLYMLHRLNEWQH